MSTHDAQERSRLWLWLALFTVLGAFSTGRWTFIPAAWVGTVFGLRFYRRYPRAGRGYWLLVLAAVVGGAIGWSGGTIFGSVHPAPAGSRRGTRTSW